MLDFITFGVADCIDILLFAIILYYVYRLLKGTAAVRIFWAIAILYVLWKVLSALHITMVGEIIGQLISVGVIAIFIVFQPEIRKFLLMIGNARILRLLHFHKKEDTLFVPEINAVVRACRRMSDSKTGALIVFEKDTPLEEPIATGEKLDAIVSRELIENIFFKNSPLHDGALIIRNHRIAAARCILPVSEREDISTDLGLRHRSAIGVTVLSDAVVVVVSEQTGSISLCRGGDITHGISPVVLETMLKDIFVNKKDDVVATKEE
ncbi:MAG: diadenylate cyclase CdaA [Bacteroidales bacterium]|nr:diadenylate cyclase CdaA [Bacteroidales bacterium]